MHRFRQLLGLVSLVALVGGVIAATPQVASGTSTDAAKHWTTDNGNGTYSNPLFYDEFEDPDIIRVGKDYYLAGSTEAHVLKGRVSIALDPNRSGQATSRVVDERLAAIVDATGRTIRDGLAARTHSFLFQLPSSSQSSGPVGRLNLADIVGGGNGRGTGTLDRGIDSGTGKAFKGLATTIRRTRRNEFRPSPQFREVDGVFVPNGASGPVVISSTGLTFSECPRTMGSYYGGPTNSGKFYDIPSQQTHTARLNGISFGTSRHPALNLHPNTGITFDFDQIRQTLADVGHQAVMTGLEPT